MKNLKILDIASNRITSLDGIEHLTSLSDLWANDNAIISLDHVEDRLRPLRENLTCVYLQGNPCALETNYKLRMLHTLPKLEQLDDRPIARNSLPT